MRAYWIAAFLGVSAACAVVRDPASGSEPFGSFETDDPIAHELGSARRAGVSLGAVLARLEERDRQGPEVGIHTGVWLGDGKPANDVPIPASVFGRMEIAPRWWARLGIELASGDFETPHEILGISQDPAREDLDSTAQYTSVLGWIERVYAPSGKDELFWQLGAGVSFVDVDDLTGPVAGGGTFDVRTDAGTEILGSVGAGYRRRYGSFAFEALVRYDRHFADWELEDRVSGASGDVDDYSTWALLVGLSWTF